MSPAFHDELTICCNYTFSTTGGTSHLSARDIFALAGRIERRARLEHRAGDTKETVGDGTERPAMTMPPRA
jgi:hypothetical protein